NPFQQANAVLLDVSDPSRVREAVDEVPIAPRFTPPYAGGRPGGGGPVLTVLAPRFDPATGDPILPDRAALYAPADAVVMRSDVLARLAGDELQALADYVLGGGTLAVAITRPEDLRQPTLVAFAGGPITAEAVSSTALADLYLPTPVAAGSGAKPVPNAMHPTRETLKTLVGHAGGNLHGSPYGNSAAYGLGEVHLLAFDPTSKPAMSDPWAEARLVDLARRAYDRRSTVVFRPGAWAAARDLTTVRKQLDPNESSRWAIAAAALLLCLYAVVAGPLNFSRASKRGRPLRALVRLPAWSAATFVVVVGIGAVAKGVRGRARHLSLVEAGAGMTEGVARRFRGFYAAKSEQLTVRTSDRGSVVSGALMEGGDHHDRLLVDRDGARLVDVAALPWQTVVVREDGVATLGDGIAIAREGGDVVVINRTGKKLRGALLRLPTGSVVYLGALGDGQRVSSRAAKPVASMSGGAAWLASITATHMGAVDVHRLGADKLSAVLEDDAPGLGDAWHAIDDAAGNAVDWFPDGAPVLLAQIDGGEGRRHDAGLDVDKDRLLVRVVGFGGAP
ncbi:MAG TPA: hypothetical protein VHB21_23835, partial [Minicystis sp.]|nr:hypothetical protein [Minicystis sp.]